MNIRYFFTIIFLLSAILACERDPAEEHTALTPSSPNTPAHVEIVKTEGYYQLRVNGEAFNVKGAGLDSSDGQNFKALANAGGNTFRTWSSKNAAMELAAAEKYNLMVAMGFDLEKELHGFDYNNEKAVAEQFERFKQTVNSYKDHPNLLVWIIANEPNLLFHEDGSIAPVNPKVYDALSDMIDYIHAVDPHHPVSYSFAGINKEHIAIALARTPQVDFVSVQVYGELATVHERIRAAGISKPFMVTEFGPLGHWEMPSTEWGREIEEPGGLKAASMADRIQKGLSVNTSGLNIGSFAFLWGQKQERTPTWYGMFNKDGTATARIDEMTKYWTGQYPKNRAPAVSEILLNDKHAVESVYVGPNEQAWAKVMATDPDSDDLSVEWEILKEVQLRSQGGAKEQEPQKVPFEILDNKVSPNSGELGFTTPASEGDYRLFAYIYDGKGKVGNANIPFYVQKPD